jgi:hypothetical protein
LLGAHSPPDRLPDGLPGQDQQQNRCETYRRNCSPNRPFSGLFARHFARLVKLSFSHGS